MLNYPSVAGDAVHLSGAGFTLNPTGVLVFNNPRAKATFKNPTASAAVEVDFCEWSAVLARSLFTSDYRIQTRVFHSEKSHSLFNSAKGKFMHNVAICLDKTLPEKGCNLCEFLTVFSTAPMGELQNIGKGDAAAKSVAENKMVITRDNSLKSVADVTKSFADGASSVEACVDLYAFLTQQDAYLIAAKGSGQLDVQLIVQASNWLRLMEDNVEGKDTRQSQMARAMSEMNRK